MHHHQRLSPIPVSEGNAAKQRPDDYVYFERSTSGFSSDAVARSTAAKLKLVSYYKMAVDSAIERNARCVSRRPVARARLIYRSFQSDRARNKVNPDPDSRCQRA